MSRFSASLSVEAAICRDGGDDCGWRNRDFLDGRPVHNYFVAAVASLTHFFVKLVLAAPESFLSIACALQDSLAASVSFSHLVT